MRLNLLNDLIPNIIGIIAAWRWAINKIEKNKTNYHTSLNIKLNIIHLSNEIYHCPITMISIVSTKGKAGYFVWKFAGGHGDHEISLPLGSLEEINFFVFDDTVSS